MRRQVQGTVSAFDAGTAEGAVLLDDGTELAFPATALDGTGLRLLRVGQRVRLDVEEDGTEAGRAVHRVQILTLA